MPGKTNISIQGEQFFINGSVTYPGILWRGHKVEGLLLNARMVQGVFDDLNPDTRVRWVYPDTDQWDPQRNTNEFAAAMPTWRDHGLLAFSLNLQGGSPYGYSQAQPWVNSAFTPEGELRTDYLARTAQILQAADALGMVVILGLFYFGQEQHLRNEAAIIQAVDNAVNWLLDNGHKNVLLEINNECDVRYQHPILMPERVHELIRRAKHRNNGDRRLLVGTSYGGGIVPGLEVTAESDFLLLHGNQVDAPDRVRAMIRETRALSTYTPKPILFNEDDNYDFDASDNNYVAAISEFASWGFFDYRREGEQLNEGFQSVPVDWGINSARKRAFFALTRQISAA